ncbi:non-homologous end-joining DNA ligase [Rhodococcus opacus]|uniref:DNA ligase (ATP) n=1 Tax=Rhodococcus opacus TaxID=37919 RepID=A0AAX3YV48_RHOOP|nr:non-homologous end-joining DNA ligase [Rhodococcus opacus]MCZ4590484.1 non-homologous end-joining DNA ligase [Rhodococcus opacus]UZG60110.1 non-homologous end-joining DNA ligase [Rhodococcus opacus]WLF52117.1 non-homologous end-joining DNA ligase [Rhodococcus opacus]
MLATLGSPPGGDDWAVEMKFDGVRAVATITPAAVHLFSRNNADITAAYPEIASGLSEIDPGRGVIVDGEIVAPAASSGRPRFDLLQQRTPIQDPPPMLQRAVPVAFYIFDLLTHRGAPILRWPYLERRQLLADLNLDLGGEALHVPPHWVDVDSGAMLEVANEHGLEGIVTKRMTSPYQPGRRSPDWVKTPLRNSAEVIVGGWEATSQGGLRSLIVGAHADQVGLVFIGHVSSGFTEADRRRTLMLLRTLERPTSPFDDHVPDELAAHARWVEPALVGTVEYREFTPNRRLRHPSWKAFRAGIDPRWVTIEELP